MSVNQQFRYFSLLGENINTIKKSEHKTPFVVFRTERDNIPVYTKKKMNGNKIYTWVFKVHGHRQLLKQEIEFLCKQPVVDRGGWFEISGDHKRLIKSYLEGLQM